MLTAIEISSLSTRGLLCCELRLRPSGRGDPSIVRHVSIPDDLIGEKAHADGSLFETQSVDQEPRFRRTLRRRTDDPCSSNSTGACLPIPGTTAPECP